MLTRTSAKLSLRPLSSAVLILCLHHLTAFRCWPRLTRVSSIECVSATSPRCYSVKTIQRLLWIPTSCQVSLISSRLAPRTEPSASGTRMIIPSLQDAPSSLRPECSLCARYSLMKLSSRVGPTAGSDPSRSKAQALFGRSTMLIRTE